MSGVDPVELEKRLMRIELTQNRIEGKVDGVDTKVAIQNGGMAETRKLLAKHLEEHGLARERLEGRKDAARMFVWMWRSDFAKFAAAIGLVLAALRGMP